jgi:Raf kinase inhibitor-like YbhB/YbcL family protein
MRKASLIVLPIALIVLAALYYKGKPMSPALVLFSSSFSQNQPIPSIHTCEGEDKPILLSWKNIPDKTLSLALIMEDPDTAQGTFVHWVAWNIDPNTKELALDNITQGTNSAGQVGYKGPCPPSGQHRYYFRLYALDKKLDLPNTTTKEELLNSMKGHIKAQAELMGTYKKIS